MAELLGKLASDETVHPDVRTWATQEGFKTVHAPYKQGKPYTPDFSKIPVPKGQSAQTAQVPGISQVPTPPPGLNVTPAQDQALPAGQAGPPSPAAGAPTLSAPALAPGQIPQPPAGLLDIPASTATLAAQPSPGIFMSPEQKTELMAKRAGAVQGAQAGAEVKSFVYQRDANGNLRQVPISGTGEPIGKPVENAVSPYSLQGKGLRSATYLDPTTGQPALGTHNLITNEVLDQQGRVVPGAVPFEPALAETIMQHYKQVTQADGSIALVPVTETSQKKLPAPAGAASKAKIGEVPMPPTAGGAQAAPAGKGGARVVGHTAVPPALQDKIQEQFQMRNSAIGLIDDITRNKSVLDSLISSGKVAVAANPDGTGVLSRLADLTPQEVKVAADFEQLIEHANLLRGPLGATGFRGQQAWSALQAQRGKPMADPRMTAQIMSGMRERLVRLNEADTKVLKGTGGDVTSSTPMVGGHQVGETIAHRDGTQWKITKIYPDGTYDGQQVKAGAKK